MRAGMLLFGAALIAVPAVIAARPVSIELPVGTVPAELAGDEAAVVVNNCAACHSLDYIVTQPRGKGAQFWRDAVAKMVNVYKAPIEQADAAAAADLLARKFG
ncbi:cytochrome C [Novosphingobium flavum]|uniref:Cytochrome C n=1 Tax=Novosphingobium flavum TaxID=1778672 RepID=A0A7X1FR59_9SPHN|nr:cytochrome C [Novosphingobium flavum]MBC2665446.1 cytochrome C [Novosphingobium flavum]